MIEKLQKEFIGTGEVKGFKFKQLHNEDDNYIYEVAENDKKHFEVLKADKSPKCLDFENRIYSETEFKHVYPKAYKFGLTAWTYKDLNDAVQKLNELEKQSKIKSE